jgi:hypothetical protein
MVDSGLDDPPDVDHRRRDVVAARATSGTGARRRKHAPVRAAHDPNVDRGGRARQAS